MLSQVIIVAVTISFPDTNLANATLNSQKPALSSYIEVPDTLQCDVYMYIQHNHVIE